jgi:hypothetical protein
MSIDINILNPYFLWNLQKEDWKSRPPNKSRRGMPEMCTESVYLILPNLVSKGWLSCSLEQSIIRQRRDAPIHLELGFIREKENI